MERTRSTPIPEKQISASPVFEFRSLKHLCVRKRSNNRYCYPRSIPKEREPLPVYISIILIFLLLITNWYFTGGTIQDILSFYAVFLVTYIGLHLLNRLILFCEEIRHVISRYDNSYGQAFKDAFSLSPTTFGVAIISICWLMYYSLVNGLHKFDTCTRSVLLTVAATYLTGEVVSVRSCYLEESLWIARNNGLDYGSGMAYSFYHGYLGLVLPQSGTESKNLKELMEIYESRNAIKFAIYKLFVLIPTSLRCFSSLMNEHSPSIEESSSLPEKRISIAGVLNRSYKNAVYKINSDKGKIYVAAEYATPLRTFKEVFYTDGEHSDYYKKYKKDIILQFYLTLEKVLKHHNTDEFCELIFYEDCYESEGRTQYYDVGNIILGRLKELKKLKKKCE